MDEKDRKLIRTLGVLSTVGITLVAATVIGLYIGLKLDAWLGTSPWLTILFLALGLFAGFKTCSNMSIRARKDRMTLIKRTGDRDGGRHGR